jgi:hypothetical protein
VLYPRLSRLRELSTMNREAEIVVQGHVLSSSSKSLSMRGGGRCIVIQVIRHQRSISLAGIFESASTFRHAQYTPCALLRAAGRTPCRYTQDTAPRRGTKWSKPCSHPGSSPYLAETPLAPRTARISSCPGCLDPPRHTCPCPPSQPLGEPGVMLNST